MKMLWRLSREAIRYKGLYIVAILSTLGLTAVNLAAPKALSAMTGIVERGVDDAGMRRIVTLTLILIGLYLLRILFRFLSNYLAHKAAWYYRQQYPFRRAERAHGKGNRSGEKSPLP